MSHVDPNYKAKTWMPFLCYEGNDPYSHEYIIQEGCIGCVRFFTDYGNELFLNIQEGVSDCPCGPRLQWFDNKSIRCKGTNPATGEECEWVRPFVLGANNCDNYIELPPGRYRICVVDCDYNPVTPGYNDLLIRIKQKADTGKC